MSSQADFMASEGPFAVPMVGREVELRVVRSGLETARSGHGQVLSLTGEPGIGKSRLAAAAAWLARDLGFVAYGGACRAPGTNSAYLVWQPIWRGLFDIDGALPVPEQQALVAARIAERDGGSDRRAPLLAPVINLPLPDSELTATLEPPLRVELLRSLLLEHLRSCAAASPLLLVLEDCHWIDPSSAALLEFLARNVADQPVLILVTSRPVEAAAPVPASLASLPHATEIRLAHLRTTAAERLVTERIGVLRGQEAEVPDGFVREIVGWAGGNPLHLEELVSFLLARNGDAPAAGSLAALGHAEDLRSLVRARTDRLADGERATIEIASVLGHRFPARWVWGSDPAVGSSDQVLCYLDRLAELEFTRRDPHAPQPEYAFKHAITREAVYESLSPPRRAVLHERVARFIERSYPDRLAQFADVLAHHYRRTGNVEKQRVWFRTAAAAARAAFATDTAIGYYEDLLALLPLEQTGQLLIELGDLLTLAAKWADAERIYHRALSVADLTDDRRVHAEGIRGLGSVLLYTRPHGQALRDAVDQLRRTVVEFERLDDVHGVAKALERLAWTSWELGDLPEALGASERHLAIAIGLSDQAGMSAAYVTMGIIRWHTGDHAEALALLEKALDAASEAGDRPRVILAANDFAVAWLDHCDHMQAIRHFWRALSVAEEIGDRRMAALAIGNIGEVHRRQGEHGRALRCFAHAFRITVEIGDRTSMANQAENLAVTMIAQGRYAEAEQLLTRAISLARRLHAEYYLSHWLHQQARFLADAGRLREADRVNREALEIAVEREQHDVELRARLLSLRLQVDLGRTERRGALGELQALRDTWIDRHEQAAVLDALWQLDPAQEQIRQEAIALYRMLYERTPTVEYREAYERLAGTRLPSAPPLPPLPDGIGQRLPEIDEIIEQLDLAIRQTAPDAQKSV
jgi:tetratricopeptide (TPR) repeat protein